MHYCNKCKQCHPPYISITGFMEDDVKWECHYSYDDVRKIEQEHLIKRYEQMQKEYVRRLIKDGDIEEVYKYFSD